MIQNDEVLAYLMTGRGLTAKEAMDKWGIMRLAARIGDLRLLGYDISSTTVKRRRRNGEMATVSLYRLV